MSQEATPSNDFKTQPVYEKSAPWVIHTLVSIGVLLIAFAVVSALFGTKPQANRWGDRPAPAVAVEITSLNARNYEVWVDSYGTAQALTETQLVAEVNGRVVSVSPKIRAGSQFNAGDVLVELDDRNFKIDVDIAASAAADAQVVYLQEVAQAEFAAQEWNQKPTSEAARKLALREPQVAAAKAALQAAESRLERAKLDLARTKIVAPFDGKVMRQTIDIGQVIAPGQAIADIYSTDAVEVRLPIKIADLAHLQLPEQETNQAERPLVMLESEMGNRAYQWQAEVVRTEGAFDPATRMLYLVARVIDPFTHNQERPAIRLGQFVRAKVQGNEYQNVFVIPRRAVSQDFVVSVAEEGVLRKRQVEPLWTDANAVVVAANQTAADDPSTLQSLTRDDQLILTPTANLPDGTRVKSLELNRGNDRPQSNTIIADASSPDPTSQTN